MCGTDTPVCAVRRTAQTRVSVPHVTSPPYPLSCCCSDWLLILPHFAAAQPGGLHHTAHFFAGVRCHFVAMLNHLRRNGEAPLGIEDDEVGIETGSDAPFAILEPGDPGGTAAHQLRNLFQREPPLAPDDGQAELQRGDAAPRVRDVAFAEALQFRRAGGV